jgi:hypothetical protein
VILTRRRKVWLEKLTEVDQERRAYQRLAAKGRMTDHGLDEELAELAETRRSPSVNSKPCVVAGRG